MSMNNIKRFAYTTTYSLLLLLIQYIVLLDFMAARAVAMLRTIIVAKPASASDPNDIPLHKTKKTAEFELKHRTTVGRSIALFK
jgi:hypothetical protein